jgi:hypothetical protein
MASHTSLTEYTFKYFKSKFVHPVQEDIFADLISLTSLDLSYNSLASLDNNIFRELQVGQKN